MLKSEPTDFNPLSAISIQLRHSCGQLIESIAHKPMARVSLVAVLGLGSVSWLGTTAIAPQSAQAYTANLEVSLSRQSRESYISFVRRAEAVARAAAQRSFDRDILVSYVAITVIGQNNGAIAPVLKLNVSRRAWRSRPDPQRWITYLPNSESLLGFNRTTGEPEIPEPTPTQQNQQQRQQPRQQRQQPTQPPQTIINIPGANIRLVPPPPQPTTLPPGAAGAPLGGGQGNNQNLNNGGAGNNQNLNNGGAGNNQNLNNGGAGNNQNLNNGGAGNNQNLNNGGAGTQAPGQSNQQGGNGTNTP